ncbi:hypothetical protein JTE90_004538 [Oedothorax gibbosus]|uniref:Uncharacterized protein n=1 Tax=Oedothorax gibbosus TaxID=931172 RepID=A0AAV6VC19_9ARAC|nr:hypothetical protein JTE90_004538 [Oedothorax gibbosus]
MDAFIKVEDCGDDFGSSVTSTVVSPMGHHDDPMTDLGFDPNSATDFGSLGLFDEKKNYFDPMAPMAEPVSTFSHHNMKKDYNYEPVVTNIRPAAVVSTDDVSNYITTSGSSPSDLMNRSPPPFSSNSYSGITILYEQKGVESTTSPHRKYMPQKGYSPTKSSGKCPRPLKNTI